MEIEDDEPISRGRVYFIVARELGTVKVGFSTNLPKRLIDLQTSASVPLTLEFSCAGDRELERAIHAFLTSYRLAGEWFRYGPHITDLTDEMMDFIDLKAHEEDIDDDFDVFVSAADLQNIVSDPLYGKTHAEIYAAGRGNEPTS